MALTLLHENGWETVLIERQVAHVQRSSVAVAYNHAECLSRRFEMMQWWADILDQLEDEVRVDSHPEQDCESENISMNQVVTL